jgi:hypothetical protein
VREEALTYFPPSDPSLVAPVPHQCVTAWCTLLQTVHLWAPLGLGVGVMGVAGVIRALARRGWCE